MTPSITCDTYCDAPGYAIHLAHGTIHRVGAAEGRRSDHVLPPRPRPLSPHAPRAVPAIFESAIPAASPQGADGKGVWTNLSSTLFTPRPSARTYSYGIAIGGTGYLGFGRDAGGASLADWWSYDTAANTFTQLASLPSSAARFHPAMIAVEADRGGGGGNEWFIYVGCGSGAAGNLKDWWEYSVKGDTWTQRADLPGPARHHPYYFDAKVASGAHYAYVGFGHGAAAEGYIFKDVYRYDPVALVWKTMNAFPGESRVAGTQFSHHFPAGNSSRGYVLSGDGDNHGSMPTGEVSKGVEERRGSHWGGAGFVAYIACQCHISPSLSVCRVPVTCGVSLAYACVRVYVCVGGGGRGVLSQLQFFNS